MRIIAGDFGGMTLASVGKGDAGAHLRPTPDRVRESLFNILAVRMDFDGLIVLDLFAGTGALGLEALSRGAAHVTFVDTSRVSLGLVRRNIVKTRTQSQTTTLSCPAERLPKANRPADLVFLDPPYAKGLGGPALSQAIAQGWIAEDTLVVWEDAGVQSHTAFQTRLTRAFGMTHITLLTPLSD